MGRPFVVMIVFVWILLNGCALNRSHEEILPVRRLPALPEAVTNNAAVAVNTKNGTYLLSFNGLLSGKRWSDTTARTYVLAPDASAWTRGPDVPGDRGRLASIAVAAQEQAYVFGGYTVAEDHSEISLPLVHRYDPVTQTFTRLADMPVPVDDAMALVYQDRYLYLLSGWHDTANINLVQRYDLVENSWVQATAYPGAPVFGHSGGIVGSELVVCGGVKIKTKVEGPREFIINQECFAGVIRADDARRIDWRAIQPMPGPARYRTAATGSDRLKGVVFVGGSNNPYNYNGVGYNGVPSAPLQDVWLYELNTNHWLSLGAQAPASMDHRGLLETAAGFITVGGMLDSQQVTNQVIAIELVRTADE